MNNRLYYINQDENQSGPFTIEELKNKRLKKSDFVWHEGLEDWKSASEIDELIPLLVAVPPPIKKKNDNGESKNNELKEINDNNTINKTEISGSIDVIPKINVQKTIFSKISNKGKIFLTLWIAIHSFALLMSTNGIKNFNTFKEINSDKFWPFVEFWKIEYYEKYTTSDGNVYSSIYDGENQQRSIYSSPSDVKSGYNERIIFKGVFTDYDFSEFVLYIFFYFFTLILFLLFKKNSV